VLSPVRQVVDDALQFAERSILGDGCFEDVLHGREEHCVAVDGDAVHLRAVRDNLALIRSSVAVRVTQQHDVPDRPARHVNRSISRDGDHARIDQPVGENTKLEPIRKLQRLQFLRIEFDLFGFQHVPGERDIGCFVGFLCPGDLRQHHAS
jgi:hypothetical protein